MGISLPFSLPFLVIVELVLVGYVEYSRGQAEGEGQVYPGGAFAPLGFGRGSDNVVTLKKKEIANGENTFTRL